MKKRKRKFRRMSKPRLPKTFAEIMQAKPTDLDDVGQFGMVLEMYPTAEDHRITVKELVEKFYDLHIIKKNEYWKKRRGPKEQMEPVAFTWIKDPAGLSPQYWIAVFYGNFYVCIYKESEVPGPHVAQLWFKSFTTRQSHWIATLQIMAYYYNEQQMKAELMKCINDREWFYDSGDAKRSILP